MYLPLIQKPMEAKYKPQKPTAVIVGLTGAGKTTLANKLCNTTHDAGAGRGSLTRNLFRNSVNVGMNSFWLIDTPGTDSSTDTYKHAFLLREALTATAINTIFVVVKFDSRFEKLADNFYSQPVNLYGKKIVVMISHLDESKDAKKDFAEICKVFAEECPDVSNIIFYSERSEAEDVADCMYSCISHMNAEKIEISDEDFQLKFNTFQATSQMRQSLKQYTRKANIVADDFMKYIHSDEFNEHQDNKDDVLHMMLVNFKNQLDAMYDTFVKEHGEKMTEMNYFTFLIKMQRENVQLCDDFTKAVIELMSYNLFDIKDPRNLIKQCPNCQEIWYKTEGCDGATTCGNRGFRESTIGSTLTQMYKFVVYYVDGKVHVKKNSAVRETPSQVTPVVSSSSGYKGCNFSFVWADLPKLDNELILSLFEVKTMDEAKAMIKGESFRKIRNNYERDIDTRFHQ